MGAGTKAHERHDVFDQWLFWGKTRVLILRRFARELVRRQRFPVRRKAAATTGPIAEDRSPLFTTRDPREHVLENGKVQNLRIAARRLDNLFIQKSDTFSFWNALGRATKGRGYVAGRELRSGCLVPSVGGGLCQLTNALSRAAHRANCLIVERHCHSTRLPGVPFDPATDATVFWNYVDFRFRPESDVVLRSFLTSDELVVQLWRAS